MYRLQCTSTGRRELKCQRLQKQSGTIVPSSGARAAQLLASVPLTADSAACAIADQLQQLPSSLCNYAL